MKKTLLRKAARTLAREVTTAELRRAATLGAARWAGKRVMRTKPARKALRYAATGLAAVVLAVPIGLYVGRRLRAED